MRLLIKAAIVAAIAVFLLTQQHGIRNAAYRMNASFRDIVKGIRAFGEVAKELPASVAALKKLRKEIETITCPAPEPGETGQ
jgi:hypothetical protein